MPDKPLPEQERAPAAPAPPPGPPSYNIINHIPPPEPNSYQALVMSESRVAASKKYGNPSGIFDCIMCQNERCLAITTNIDSQQGVDTSQGDGHSKEGEVFPATSHIRCHYCRKNFFIDNSKHRADNIEAGRRQITTSEVYWQWVEMVTKLQTMHTQDQGENNG